MLFFNKGKHTFQEAERTSNVTQKLQLYKEAAELGYAPAAYALAREYDKLRYNSLENEALRGTYYVQAAQAGIVEAYRNAGEAFATGVGVEKNLEMACSFYKKDYDRLPLSFVAYRLAELYEEQGCYAEALKWVEKAEGWHKEEGLQERLNKLVDWEKLSAEELTEKADQLYDQKEFEDSFLMFKLAAARGNARAAYCLGFDYYFEKGTKADYKAAFYWLHQAELAEYKSAFFNLGLAYREGKGVPKDLSTAFSYFQRAVERGDSRAYLRIGDAYRLGEGTEIDEEKARSFYLKSIEANRSVGACCYNMALIEREKRRFSEAMEWANKAAAQKYTESKYLIRNLQLDLAQADSTNADQFQQALRYTITGHKTEAFQIFYELAKKNHRDATRELAICYDSGRGVPQDKAKAVDYYKKLVDMGDWSVCFRIAQAYHRGEGCVQSYSSALSWYKESYNRYKKDRETVYNIFECELASNLPGCNIIAENWIEEAEKLGDHRVPTMKRKCENTRVLRGSSSQNQFYRAEELCNNGHPKEAFALYQKAAESGHTAAQKKLADYDRNGVYLKNPHVMRRQSFEELVASQSLDSTEVKRVTDRYKDNDAQALFSQGITYSQMAFRRDSEKEKNDYSARSFILFKMAADKGHGLASKVTAQNYEEGNCGVKVNKYRAFLYYLQAAEGGVQSAYFPVGIIYLEGIVVDQDVDKAIQWLTKCAEWPDLKGVHSDMAAYRLAEIYFQRKMLGKAMTWAKKAKAFKYAPEEELDELINRILLADTHETYNLVLISTGENRAHVMAQIRVATGWSLMEAMERTKSLPATIMSAASEKEAEDLCAALIKYGAKVELMQVD